MDNPFTDPTKYRSTLGNMSLTDTESSEFNSLNYLSYQSFYIISLQPLDTKDMHSKETLKQHTDLCPKRGKLKKNIKSRPSLKR